MRPHRSDAAPAAGGPGRWAARALAVVLAGVLLASTAAAVAAAGLRYLLRVPDGDDGVITLLLLGSDEGPPRRGDPLRARADGIQLLFVSPDRRHAAFVSIPRDTFVPVAGRGTTKINACLNGGPERCVATVEQNWGVDVDHWLLTSMEGFKQGVHQFGGVVIDVPRALRDGCKPVPAGRRKLTGCEALTYVRDRKSRPEGDVGRSAAQAEVLAAAHRMAVEQGLTLRRVAEIVGIVQRTTATDASAADLFRLALVAATLPPENVTRAVLPGRLGSAGGASVYRVGGAAAALIADAADGIIGDG